MEYNITYRQKNKSLQCIISYKNSAGIWKQVSKQGYKTQKEYKKWIENTTKELSETIEYINPEFAKLTFKELYKSYMTHIVLYKEQNTLTVYEMARKYFEKLNDLEVSKISSIEIQECIDEMVKLKLAPSTIKTYTAKIKTILKYAVTKKIIKNIPMHDIEFPKERAEVKVKALNKLELDTLLSKITHKKFYLISLIAATCGLRLGEILGLTWDRIGENTITVNRQWKVIGKKDDKAVYGFGTVKSKNSNRVVPVPPSTMNKIKEYKKIIDISNRLFPYKGLCSCTSPMNKLYKTLGYNISAHDLRHTYASMLVANGMDFKSVSELLGDDVNTVIKTYSHFTDDMMTNATRLVNSIF